MLKLLDRFNILILKAIANRTSQLRLFNLEVRNTETGALGGAFMKPLDKFDLYNEINKNQKIVYMSLLENRIEELLRYGYIAIEEKEWNNGIYKAISLTEKGMLCLQPFPTRLVQFIKSKMTFPFTIAIGGMLMFLFLLFKWLWNHI